MIYACLRAWRECPNLFLWNVGAWGILAMAAGVFAEMFLPTDISYGCKPAIPPPPTFAESLHGVVTSEAFHYLQVGIAICGFILMAVAVVRAVRSVHRRMVRH